VDVLNKSIVDVRLLRAALRKEMFNGEDAFDLLRREITHEVGYRKLLVRGSHDNVRWAFEFVHPETKKVTWRAETHYLDMLLNGTWDNFHQRAVREFSFRWLNCAD
jgi:hypothetical protein